MSEQRVEGGALRKVLRAHRADSWCCSCGWPLNDSVGSWVDHLAEQVRPLMRCPAHDPEGLQCRLFFDHGGLHGDGLGTVWATTEVTS